MTDPQKNSEIPHPDQETRIAVVEIDHKVSQDIESDIWKKYILNCAYNKSTTFYDNTIGRHEKELSQDGRSILHDMAAQTDGPHIMQERRSAAAPFLLSLLLRLSLPHSTLILAN